MSIDYQAELKRLEESTGDYWKPKAGQHKIKALGEIEEADPFIQDDAKPDSLPQPRAQIKIKIELTSTHSEIGKEYIWNIPKGKTAASTYGQLVRLAAAKGKLTGEVFTVVAVGEGQNIRYTIVL